MTSYSLYFNFVLTLIPFCVQNKKKYNIVVLKHEAVALFVHYLGVLAFCLFLQLFYMEEEAFSTTM